MHVEGIIGCLSQETTDYAHWLSLDDYDREYTGDNFFKSFMKHLVIGVDYVPSDNFWLGIGYNPKTALDMKLQGGNALAGFSGGAGVRIKMFDGAVA